MIISRDTPCNPILPSTYVEASCDPLHSYQPTSGSPIYIGIFAFSTAKFTLLVSPLGQQVQLLAGQPQLSHTSTSIICPKRSSDTGICLSAYSSDSKEIQAAYFSFYASPPSKPSSSNRHLIANEQLHSNKLKSMTELQTVFDFILSVVPMSCNTTTTNMLKTSSTTQYVSSNKAYTRSSNNNNAEDICPLGCDCEPLTIYINSCPLSKCTANLHKPSIYPGQHAYSLGIYDRKNNVIFHWYTIMQMLYVHLLYLYTR